MDNQLSGRKHLDKLFGWKDEDGKKHKGKLEFIKNNLTPLIRNISLDYRANLWQVLVRPLFIPIALLSNYVCNSVKNMFMIKLKKSLKWFLGLAKTVPDHVVFSLVDVNFDEWARVEEARAKSRWVARVERREVGSLEKYSLKFAVRLMPKEVALFINLQCVLCKVCGYRLSSSHYRLHGIQVPDTSELCNELRRLIANIERSGLKCDRRTLLIVIGSRVREYTNRMCSFLQSYDAP